MGDSPSKYPASYQNTNGPRPESEGAARVPRPQNMYHQTHVKQPMPQPRVRIDLEQILERIEKTIVHWSPIIKNSKEDFKSKKGFSLSYLQYLSFELHQTETEWHDIIKLLPKQIERSEDHRSREPIPKENSMPVPKSNTDAEYKRNFESMQDIIKELSKKLSEEKECLAINLEENDRLREQLRHMKEENENLLLRLSKVASDRLLKSNANIADLSDPNRPTKIGEAYSEAYDNEYTDAFSELNEAGYTEIEAVDILRETLLNTFEFCSKKSAEFFTKSEDALKMLFLDESEPMGMVYNLHGDKRWTLATLSPGQVQGKYIARELTNNGDLQFALKWKPKDREAKSEMGQAELIEKRTSMSILQREKEMKAFEDQMKKLRKEIAVHMVPYIQKVYLMTRWDADCIEGMKPFIKKCVFLTWLMTVQSPPMAFLQPPKAEGRFDGDRYRSYTKSGETIDYVVWPTLMLTKDGPIIIKGIAQGK